MKICNALSTVKWVGLLTFMTIVKSCNSPEKFYSADDFALVQKIDAHFHYLTMNEEFLKLASNLNFHLLSPNWDGEYSIDEQMKIAHKIWLSNPKGFAFFGTFSVDSFGQPEFADLTIARIRQCLQGGASGIKIWKNIGMVLKDQDGKFVMIDDPAFDPVFTFLEENNIPVLAHLGEPKDCWLPESEMTDPGDKSYYRNNPEYHMYLHPEVPSYDDQITARDNILKKYPKLDFIGAHLGSLEWNIDELAQRFDMFPNFKVDMAARLYHLQYQSKSNREKVRNFMIKYQDRILYATDNEVHDISGTDTKTTMRNLQRGWMAQWSYLATDSVINNTKGLKLPKDVIDKIYFKNAKKYFNQKQN